MKPLSKFEAYGILGSVAMLALVLTVIRYDFVNITELANTDAQQSASVIVVDETNANEQSALANAIVDGAAGGELTSMIVDDVTIGEGTSVTKGDTVTVQYIGRLQNGQEFDNSYTRGMPFTFTVGEGKVIQGWDEGVVGMRVGGQRILVIPSDMAYGKSGYGPIPGGATLVFSIELLEIQ